MQHSTRMSVSFRSCFGSLCRWKAPIIVILLPLLLLPLPLVLASKVSKGAYVVLIMGTFWVLEVMPIAVTSLIPIILFPLLGIMPAREVCFNYAEDTIILFLGSLIVAVAVERCNLHRRIALRALTLVGPEPRWLLLGIMSPCWFLSMWMSNTATAAMMMPILNAILKQIKDVTLPDIEEARHSGDDVIDDDNDVEITTELHGISIETTPLKSKAKNQKENTENTPRSRADKEADFHELAKIFALGIAYAANAGGVATLTGTPPNIILKGYIDKFYRPYNIDPGLTFANWLIFGLPTSVLVFLMTWLWLQLWYLRKRCLCCIKDNRSWDAVKEHLRMEYTSLGSMTFAEVVVAVCFILLAVLWITRDPQFIDGWGALFPNGFVKDSTPAIFVSLIMFVLPVYPPRWFSCCWRKYEQEANLTVTETNEFAVANTEKNQFNQEGFTPLLTWKTVNDAIAWDVVLLMGGGFALADGCSKSGLSDWIGIKLEVLGTLSPWAISLLLAFGVAAVTNITSNSATATVFLPIAADLALRLEINPMYLMIPVAVSASFAYVLPVGTPPNAIVFTSGYLQMIDMLKIGIVVNVLAVLILVLMNGTLAVVAYDLDSFPLAFRKQANTTLNASSVISFSNSLIGYNVTLR
ncbi:hypothetical protein CHS0354_023442 [Potamilus streckersoni]|uniref:Solute carrier family 13 member 5 n=1 Tax=Potamilus streckersoni TaxID=2493646 RepID=A0AAE0VL60_9BIVA|nr:hypothetical protein CHS0354_023442 [Potamilus streckersoni]